jgi:hypothetical protein
MCAAAGRTRAQPVRSRAYTSAAGAIHGGPRQPLQSSGPVGCDVIADTGLRFPGTERTARGRSPRRWGRRPAPKARFDPGAAAQPESKRVHDDSAGELKARAQNDLHAAAGHLGPSGRAARCSLRPERSRQHTPHDRRLGQPRRAVNALDCACAGGRAADTGASCGPCPARLQPRGARTGATRNSRPCDLLRGPPVPAAYRPHRSQARNWPIRCSSR